MVNHWTKGVRKQLAELSKDIPLSAQEDIKRLCEIAESAPEYTYRKRDFIALKESLCDVENLREVAKILEEVAHSCGFDYASIFLLKSGSELIFTNRVCTSLPKDWLLRYDKKDYRFVDPVVAHAMQSSGSFLFSDLPELPSFMMAFWSDALAHGVGREGCCFTYHMNKGIQIGISYNSMQSQSYVSKHYAENQRDLQEIGELACDAFVSLSSTFHVERCQLKIEELRYLKSLIWAVDDISAIALLQDGRTQSLRKSIYQKLKVRTISQALFVVSQQHCFDELPFEDVEVSKSYIGLLEHKT